MIENSNFTIFIFYLFFCYFWKWPASHLHTQLPCFLIITAFCVVGWFGVFCLFCFVALVTEDSESRVTSHQSQCSCGCSKWEAVSLYRSTFTHFASCSKVLLLSTYGKRVACFQSAPSSSTTRLSFTPARPAIQNQVHFLKWIHIYHVAFSPFPTSIEI